MSGKEIVKGVVLDEEVRLTLSEVCDACGVEKTVVIEMVHEGIVEPIDDSSSHWEFTGVAVARLRTAFRLQRDLEVNLAGAALALDLLDEIDALRGLQRRGK